MKFELEIMYPEFMVEALIETNMKDSSQWRPNPGVPELEEATQFKCRVEDSEIREAEDRRESETSLEARLAKEQTSAILNARGIGPEPSASSCPQAHFQPPLAAPAAPVKSLAAPADHNLQAQSNLHETPGVHNHQDARIRSPGGRRKAHTSRGRRP